jgi:hypothetical protein
MTNINYTTDLLKHYVRRDGWLPASKAQLGAISGTGKRGMIQNCAYAPLQLNE